MIKLIFHMNYYWLIDKLQIFVKLSQIIYQLVSKAQLSKMIQSEGFLGRLFGPLLKTGLPLLKNVVKPLAKSLLITLGLTAAASAADAGKHKKNLRLWNSNTNNIKWWNGRHNENS